MAHGQLCSGGRRFAAMRVGGRARRVATPVGGLLLLFAASVAVADEARPEPTPGPTAESEWIRPEEVPARADALLRRLDGARPDAAAQSSLEEIEKSLPRLSSEIEPLLAQAAGAVERSDSPVELEDIRRELTGTAAPLNRWNEELEAQSKKASMVLDEIAQGERSWLRTRDRPETAAAGDVVVRRVETSIEALKDAAATMRAWRARVLAVSDQVIDRIGAVDAALGKLRAATVGERASVFIPDRAPLWARGFGSEIRSELPRVPGEIFAYAESTFEYVARDPRPLIVQALMAGVLMFALGRFAARAPKRLAGKETATRAARLLERPYSIALLVTLMASPILHPLAPRRFVQLVAVAALLPAARIVTHASERANPALFVGVFALLLLDRVGLALQALPALERATFLLMLAFAFGLLLWFSRRAELEGVAPWLRRCVNLALVALGLALLAELGGWSYLATLLGRGVIASAVAALYIYAAVIALAALSGYALTSDTLRRSHLVARNTAMLQRSAERGLRWCGIGLWLYFLAMSLGLRSAAGDMLSALLNAGVSMGALSLSIGGILGFVLTLVAAHFLARVVTAVLEADVYPRTHLSRGVPFVLSTLIRYGSYSLGFFLALGAAGVHLDQVAIMIGGLGIGIGLGLQDLVKNFAAGLTLLFERRVRVGDALEMPTQGISGRVLSIGTRASVVRAWNGAEVVVPNADLIANAVTNWTLSDHLCRIEVPVGVAYGTDPERVLAILLDAVRSNDHLLAAPAPETFFVGFGESSLDFIVRAWIDEGFPQARSRTSELALAVHRKLAEAGITIPFPQRDLRVASISPEARAALAAADGANRKEPED